MKTLYLDCSMGAAGDMLMAALLELVEDREGFLAAMNGLGLPGVEASAERAVKCGVAGTHVRVTVHGAEEHSEDVHEHDHEHDHEHEHHHDHDHEHEHHHDHDHDHEHRHDHDHDHEHHHDHDHGHSHHHAGPAEIRERIAALRVPEEVRADVQAVYDLLAEAESRAHGVPVSEIHFHEVGTLDAIADITGVTLLLHMLKPERIEASPVHVGSGQVRCAHGVLPVPAPATAQLLTGIPTYGGAVRGELCTPTGAALLKHFVQRFGPQPAMAVEKIGYGMGQKEFEAANCVRALLGEAGEEPDTVAELSCNLDDMTPEAVAFAQERLLEQGALDVFTAPIGMKKGRSAVLLTCLCPAGERERFARLMLRHTSTLGVRETLCRRYTLRRELSVRQTPYGEVRVKTAEGEGIFREKAEYEDVARIAREQDLPLSEVLKLL